MIDTNPATTRNARKSLGVCFLFQLIAVFSWQRSSGPDRLQRAQAQQRTQPDRAILEPPRVGNAFAEAALETTHLYAKKTRLNSTTLFSGIRVR